MSRRRMHSLLMGLEIERKIAKKGVYLSGVESAQRKSFLNALADELEAKERVVSSPEKSKSRHLQVVKASGE